MEFATPSEAEDAFYNAFSRCDLDAMMSIWMDADHIECIHPGAARLHGTAAVRYSWQQIFKQGDQLQFHIVRHHCTQSGNLAIHSVSEQIQTGHAESAMRAEVVATNIYELTADGWRMILHHASPAQLSRESPTTMH